MIGTHDLHFCAGIDLLVSHVSMQWKKFLHPVQMPQNCILKPQRQLNVSNILHKVSWDIWLETKKTIRIQERNFRKMAGRGLKSGPLIFMVYHPEGEHTRYPDLYTPSKNVGGSLYNSEVTTFILRERNELSWTSSQSNSKLPASSGFLSQPRTASKHC